MMEEKKIKICALTTISKTMDWFIVDSMRNLAKNGYDVTLICNMEDGFAAANSDYAKCKISQKDNYTLKCSGCGELSCNVIKLDSSGDDIQKDYVTETRTLYVNIQDIKDGELNVSSQRVGNFINFHSLVPLSCLGSNSIQRNCPFRMKHFRPPFVLSPQYMFDCKMWYGLTDLFTSRHAI